MDGPDFRMCAFTQAYAAIIESNLGVTLRKTDFPDTAAMLAKWPSREDCLTNVVFCVPEQ